MFYLYNIQFLFVVKDGIKFGGITLQDFDAT